VRGSESESESGEREGARTSERGGSESESESGESEGARVSERG
jgi:hypothetical protein